MGKTEFSEFAQRLGVTFQGDRSPEKFVQDLFKEIYLPDAEENPVENTLPRTYKAYYYGDNDISYLAKKIAGSLDTAGFAKSIETDIDSAVERLCDVYKDDCPGINASNYNSLIAVRFQQIIENAATTKKRKKNELKAIDESSSAVSVIPKNDELGVLLMAEAGSICPNDGCTKSLFVNENGHLGMLYDIAIIDPALPKDDLGNMIVMCPTCCTKYNLGKTAEMVSRMKAIKQALVDAYEAREITSEQNVEQSVRNVLEKIPNLPRPMNVDLNYDPVPVRRKIEADNSSLYLKAQGHVNVYYSAVDEVFRQMEAEGRLRFKSFCYQVRINYLNLKDKGYDQRKIYFEMTKWLHNATNEEWDSCEIVISYFVQKCEVFDVITE